jgi:predicted nucleic acid-binding Zn ribbon protein
LARFHNGAGKEMKSCKNCGKAIQDNMTFCSKDCVEDFKNNKQNLKLFNIELEMLKDAVGCKAELQLSRGSPVKGKIIAFDQQYGKIAVEVEVNDEIKTTIVKLNYVVAFSIFKPKQRVLQ